MSEDERIPIRAGNEGKLNQHRVRLKEKLLPGLTAKAQLLLWDGQANELYPVTAGQHEITLSAQLNRAFGLKNEEGWAVFYPDTFVWEVTSMEGCLLRPAVAIDAIDPDAEGTVRIGTNPDHADVEVTNSSKAAIAVDDKLTVFYSPFDEKWYSVAGGAASDMRIVTALQPSYQEGFCWWVGELAKPSAAATAYCADQFTGDGPCYLAILSKNLGSTAITHATLQVNHHYMGFKIGKVGDVPVYAIEIAENFAYPVTLTTGGAAGATITNINLPIGGPAVSAVNWTNAPMSPGDRCMCVLNQSDNIYYLTKAGSPGTTDIYHLTVPSPGVAPLDQILMPLPGGGSALARNWSSERMNAEDYVTLYKDSFDGSWNLIKSGGGLGSEIYHITIVEGVDAGQTTELTLPTGLPVTATNWAPSAMTVGDKAHVYKDAYDGTWILFRTPRDGETRGLMEGKVTFAFTKDTPAFSVQVLHDDAGGVAPGTLVAVQNLPSGSTYAFSGKVGDGVVFRRSPLTAAYRVVYVHSIPKNAVWQASVLSESIPAGQTGLIQLPDNTIGVSGQVTARNWSSFADAKLNELCVAWQDQNSLGYYFMTSGRATRLFHGRLNARMNSADANGSLTGSPLSPLDGGSEVTGIPTASNVFHQSGMPNDWVLIAQVRSGSGVTYEIVQAGGHPEIFATEVSEDLLPFQSTEVPLASGEVVTAMNWSYKTIDQGDAVTAYKNQVDESWYLIKSGGDSTGTRWFRGQISEGISSGSSGADVINVVGLDGKPCNRTYFAGNPFRLAALGVAQALFYEIISDIDPNFKYYELAQVNCTNVEMLEDIQIADGQVIKYYKTITVHDGGEDLTNEILFTLALQTIVTRVFTSGLDLYMNRTQEYIIYNLGGVPTNELIVQGTECATGSGSALPGGDVGSGDTFDYLAYLDHLYNNYYYNQ